MIAKLRANPLVEQFMSTDVQTCSAGDSVQRAAQDMAEHDVGDVVVLADDGTVCGIVTDRDITIRAVAKGWDPATTSLDQICTRTVVSAQPRDEAEHAASRMREHGIRRLPVIEKGQVLGFVSLGDLAVARDPDSALADISGQPPTD